MKKNIEFYNFQGKNWKEVIEKTTHMTIAAHHDDIEIMSYEAIAHCFNREDKSFFGVVVTDGSGSARDGEYKNYTNEEMKAVRIEEQKKAAHIGEYGLLAMMNHPSSEVKNPNNIQIIDEISEMIKMAKPEFIYTHNLADKHDTHIGVVTKVIKAIRNLNIQDRPKLIYGCEVWRNLDWVVDTDKIFLDTSKYPNLASSLVEVFDSQISGGKRYDLAAIGRRLANATFSESHAIDQSQSMTYAMDLTPLIDDDSLDIEAYVLSYIERFKLDVQNRVKKMLGK